MARPKDIFRSGYVAILGRPNVGKSTLLNRVLGEKISIVSDKPQTTRNRIVGIYNLPKGSPAAPGGAQIVFLDTPGIHKGKDSFNKWMVDQALSTLSEVEVALFVVEANNAPGAGDTWIAQTIGKSGKPAILVGNKIDLVPEELRAGKVAAYLGLAQFDSVAQISASTGEGIEPLIEEIAKRLPEGPAYFPEDQLTDIPERFVAAEIVREKAFEMLRQEIPYAVAVVTDTFKEGEPIHIECTIHVERESQKGIVIGKGGEMLKAIGTAARKDLEKLLAAKVFLKLWVKVKPDWTRDPRALRALGYTTEDR
ncbi:MAG TPA: GTPase Era [bacterium]|nr:GTPase Era [bacterium]